MSFESASGVGLIATTAAVATVVSLYFPIADQFYFKPKDELRQDAQFQAVTTQFNRFQSQLEDVKGQLSLQNQTSVIAIAEMQKFGQSVVTQLKQLSDNQAMQASQLAQMVDGIQQDVLISASQLGNAGKPMIAEVISALEAEKELLEATDLNDCNTQAGCELNASVHAKAQRNLATFNSVIATLQSQHFDPQGNLIKES